ncbi:MAG TPA: hypothetical protein VHX86_16630 [Tepidisphaeraceae bacterium]|jgi:hypothetical protein|nr:hypothetical protein [Tepidisphaeraceae bacterium]
MDELIELIVRALIALFSNRSDTSQKPKMVPKVPPQAPSPEARRQMQQRARPAPMQRQQAILQQMMRSGPPPKSSKKRTGSPPPLNRALPAVPTPSTVPPATPPPPAGRPRLSATAIGQLISSRPNALRSVYVLSEVIQPPLALREVSASPSRIMGGWPG